MGFGFGSTELDGRDIMDGINDKSVNELFVDITIFKIGWGPFGEIPIYTVLELDGVGHRIYNNYDNLQFNSYLFGPGIVYYPIPLIQLGTSIGYSWVAIQENTSTMTVDESKGGIAANISAAIDLGKRNHGCLIGLKYFYATNRLRISDIDMNSSMVSVFVKYAYRKKVSSIEDEEPKKPKQAKQAVLYESQSPIRTFAVKNFDKIVENDQNGSGEHLNSLILLMESEGTPKDEALILIKRAIRKANGNAEIFANELESSAE
jgi:hypothetical protein